MLKVKKRNKTLWIMGTFLGKRIRKTTKLPLTFRREAEKMRVAIEKEIADGHGQIDVVFGKSSDAFRGECVTIDLQQLLVNEIAHRLK